MKLVQNYPLNWNGKLTFELMDTKVVRTFKSLKGSGVDEFPLKDISPVVSATKSASPAWENIGWFFAGCFLVTSLLHGSLLIKGIFVVVALLSFLCTFLLKEEYEMFKNKNTNDSLFYIKNPRSSEVSVFIEALKSKIS
jgi:hypothetical protein